MVLLPPLLEYCDSSTEASMPGFGLAELNENELQADPVFWLKSDFLKEHKVATLILSMLEFNNEGGILGTTYIAIIMCFGGGLWINKRRPA